MELTVKIGFPSQDKNLGQTTHAAHGGGGAKCDQHMETFIKCIKASGETVKLPR